MILDTWVFILFRVIPIYFLYYLFIWVYHINNMYDLFQIGMWVNPMKFPGFFLPPTYNTFESSQKASFLHYTLIISAATLLLFGILNLSWNAITLGWLLIGISGFCIPIIILNKSDQYYLAAFLFSTLLFIAIFYNLVDGAALHDPVPSLLWCQSWASLLFSFSGKLIFWFCHGRPQLIGWLLSAFYK